MEKYNNLQPDYDYKNRIAEVGTLPPEERLAYENSLKSYRDLKNVTDSAFDEGKEVGFDEGKEVGFAEGEESGMVKGAQQKAVEVARVAIAMGLADAQIAALSGLAAEQIAGLREV